MQFGRTICRAAGLAAPIKLVIAAAALAAASGCMLATPSRAHIGAAPPDLHAVNVDYASRSGSDIHAWFARGRPHAGAVLLLHGVGANRTAMLGRARFLHALGFTVLAPDFQAHGESPGDHITFGARESLDAAASLEFLRHAMPGERVGVIGVSMGGAAALLGPGPLPANAFVLESVYPTIRQALSDRLDAWFGPLGGIARLFTPAVLHIVGSDVGVTENELEPIDRISRLHAPLLLISGTADPYTPIVEAESLYARAPAPKSYWAVNGAGHEDLHAYAPVEYERRVGAFLEKALRTLTPDTVRLVAADSSERR
jgi:pimeloyl-ACP methyl ester carboxylesterase